MISSLLIFASLAGVLSMVLWTRNCDCSYLNGEVGERPWGTYKVLLQGPRYKIKEITVNPGASLSLQSHNHRSEHWVVVEGIAKVTVDEKIEFLQENQSTYIPVRSKHRLQNPGSITLKIVEVQNGYYIGEDDIIRYEDIYGRTNDQNKIN